MSSLPQWQHSIDDAAYEIIARVGKDLRVALPLGLGKPVTLVNALYRRAKQDPSISLTLLTALSLAKPVESDPVRKRLLQPVFDRLFQGVPDLDYVLDLSRGTVPDNIAIKEFYFSPGARLHNTHAQQHYISSNYTHASRDVFAQGANVCLQMLAQRHGGAGNLELSLSCNPDTSLELIELLRGSGRPCICVGVINERLPFMEGDAVIAPEAFDVLVDAPEGHHELFATPKLLPVTTSDYMIGLHASALVPDGGTLQIGIGALADAIVHALRLRQHDNKTYRDALQNTGVLPLSKTVIDAVGGIAPFDVGLYGATEMFVEGFLHLYRAGILKREVYDFWALQMLVNAGSCHPQQLTPEVLDGLEALGVREIRGKDFDVLQHHGLFNDSTRYERGHLITADGTRISANVADPQSRRVMAEQCLGAQLRNGVFLHGGFFLGSRDFYQGLRDLPMESRRKIGMTSVYKINQLDHNPRMYKAQRINARFINTGMVATLNGAVTSDTLDNGQVVSGVGGQYNFVAMAHQLPGGHSILMVRAVRDTHGKPVSNIVYSYGSCTIPRHLRDIVITEYGIADLRSKSDSDCIKAMLNVADSRFQQALLQQAKKAGKIAADYAIPAAYRNNTPQRLAEIIAPLQRNGAFPAYPFGCDFTEQELVLARALKTIAASSSVQRLRAALPALLSRDTPPWAQTYLDRLQLRAPRSVRDRVLQKLLLQQLAAMNASA